MLSLSDYEIKTCKLMNYRYKSDKEIEIII